jgi:uncharacterized protein
MAAMAHRFKNARFALIAALGIAFVSPFMAAEGFKKLADFEGRWIGSFTGEGDDLLFELNIIKGGALFSVPAQRVRGMPVADIAYKEGILKVIISSAVPAVELSGRAEGDAVSGDFLKGGEKKFSFSMRKSTIPARRGEDVIVKVKKGGLPGTLVLPDALSFPGKRPLALILADSGPADRDGNNHSIPGSNDCLLQLADALAKKGIASLRYDKRGAGEAYPLAPEEGNLLFDDYARDAVDAIRQFSKDKRFSSIIVVGHGEGSTVGMIAAREGGAGGFVSLAGPGLPAWRLIQDQLSGMKPEPGEDRAAREKAWTEILESLKAGKRVKDVPEDLMGLFRPSVQPYLISWFAVDPKDEIGKLKVPVQIIQGGNDLRVGPDDARALSEGAKAAREAFLPGMNHVLKDVLPLEDDNWTAYSDPAYPLSGGIATVIEQFILEKIEGRPASGIAR